MTLLMSLGAALRALTTHTYIHAWCASTISTAVDGLKRYRMGSHQTLPAVAGYWHDLFCEKPISKMFACLLLALQGCAVQSDEE